MIDNLVSGKEFSPFVIIKDSLAAPGDNLLLCWSHQLSRRSFVVVALHCGTTKLGYETLDIDCLEGMQCDSDLTPLSSVLARLKSHPRLSNASSDSTSVAFVIPDLNSLFLFFPRSSVFSFLDSLVRIRPSSFLICLLHRDCFPASILPSLDYLSRTSVTLHPSSFSLSSSASSSTSSSSSSSQLSFLADVFHKKSSGKVTRGRFLTRLCSDPPGVLSAEDISKLTVINTFDKELTSTESTTTKPSPQIAYEGSASSSDDPTANLTFNLSLSDKEKGDREKVVLPFSKKKTGQGRIIYEAEDEDDFDEEDPDDDLNI